MVKWSQGPSLKLVLQLMRNSEYNQDLDLSSRKPDLNAPSSSLPSGLCSSYKFWSLPELAAKWKPLLDKIWRRMKTEHTCKSAEYFVLNQHEVQFTSQYCQVVSMSPTVLIHTTTLEQLRRWGWGGRKEAMASRRLLCLSGMVNQQNISFFL